jgi:hypothetical protein
LLLLLLLFAAWTDISSTAWPALAACSCRGLALLLLLPAL